MRKGFKKELDFTFVRAPHKIPTKDEFDTEAEEGGTIICIKIISIFKENIAYNN